MRDSPAAAIHPISKGLDAWGPDAGTARRQRRRQSVPDAWHGSLSKAANQDELIDKGSVVDA